MHQYSREMMAPSTVHCLTSSWSIFDWAPNRRFDTNATNATIEEDFVIASNMHIEYWPGCLEFTINVTVYCSPLITTNTMDLLATDQNTKFTTL